MDQSLDLLFELESFRGEMIVILMELTVFALVTSCKIFLRVTGL